MYKLVIIDDEPIIRAGLRTIVDWASFDIEICGESENGLDGLSLCRDLKPDIAIVDLKMPGMDGIEMIEEARCLGIKTDFIVLSGYSDFTYAQKATEFGVRSYLVKPIEPTQLLAKLKMLRLEWEERDKLQMQWQAAAALRVERVLQQLCEDKAVTDKAESSELAPFLTSDGQPWEQYNLYLLGEERDEASLAEWRKVQEAIELQLSSLGACVTGFVKPYLVVLTDCLGISELVDRLVDENQELSCLDIVVAAAHPVHELSNIHLAYQKAYRMMKDKFLHERFGNAIVPSDIGNELKVMEVSIESYAAKAAEHIAASDEAAIGQILESMGHAIIQSHWHEARIKSALAAFYVETVGRLAAIDESVRTYAQPLHIFVEELKLCCTYREASGYVEQELHRLMVSWRKDRKHDTFAQLLDYVATHYGSGLTLESLARTFHYNSSYLGKLFKAQTGKTFNAYLDEIRMKQAKRMLAQGSKVYEVATAIGYANVDYFHAKFKRLEGESPSAFRDRWGGSNRT